MRRVFGALLLLTACGRTGLDGPIAPGEPTPEPTATSTPGAPGLDPAFGTQGVATLAMLSVRVHGAAVTNGKILVAGTSDTDWFATRFNADGSPDGAFGVLRVDETGDGALSGFAMLPDGRFLLAGSWNDDGAQTVAIRRYLPDASEDGSFVIDRPHGDASPLESSISIALAASGDVFLARTRRESNGRTRFFVEQLDTDGSLVAGFDGDGVSQIDVGNNDYAYPAGLAIDAAGRVVLAGGISRNGQHDLFVARFLPDGSLDTSWSADGTTEITGGVDDRAATVAIHDDGKVTVAGSTDGASLLCARFSGTGNLEDFATLTGTSASDGVFGALAEPGGSLVIAGARDDRFTAVRVRADGTPDPALSVSLASPSPAAARAIAKDGAAFVFAGDAPDEIVLARWKP